MECLVNIHFSINRKFIVRLKKIMNTNTLELIRTALGFLSWAVDEEKSGRIIVSTDPKFKNIKQVVIIRNEEKEQV